MANDRDESVELAPGPLRVSMPPCKSLLTLALWMATVSVAAGQQPPKTPCDFDGFDTNSKLAEVKAATTAYYGCAAGNGCLPINLKQADPVVISSAQGGWTCGYLATREGSAQGWVRSDDIRMVKVDQNPPLSAWSGTWVQDENRIHIQSLRAPGTVSVHGRAYWHGRGDNVHEGELSVRARPVGNRIHLEDQLCKIDLALLGNYLLTNDNNMCGGANVRFWGVWKHARAAEPFINN